MFKKLPDLVKKMQSIVGIVLAITAAFIAFNDTMKQHYPSDTQPKQ